MKTYSITFQDCEPGQERHVQSDVSQDAVIKYFQTHHASQHSVCEYDDEADENTFLNGQEWLDETISQMMPMAFGTIEKDSAGFVSIGRLVIAMGMSCEQMRDWLDEHNGKVHLDARATESLNLAEKLAQWRGKTHIKL